MVNELDALISSYVHVVIKILSKKKENVVIKKMRSCFRSFQYPRMISTLLLRTSVQVEGR